MRVERLSGPAVNGQCEEEVGTEALRYRALTKDRETRCKWKATVRIGTRCYCERHGGIRALEILLKRKPGGE